MNFYPFHIGDYAGHTRHLSLLEDLAYRRLLDAYYLAERPLNGSPADVARTIGMRDHADAVEYVLSQFFEACDEGWRNKRADQEIAHYTSKRQQASSAGKASAQRRLNGRSTDVQPTLTTQPTDVQPTKNQEPRTNTNSTRSRSASRPAEVSEAVWSSFLQLRKAKRAPVTDVVMAGIQREAAACGYSLERALTTCVERGWQSFRSDWVDAKPAAVNNPIGVSYV